jgi:hypothetical protein
MSESILNTIKKPLGLAEDYNVFDPDIIMHINTVIWELRELGVGNNDFNITGSTETWEDYLGEDEARLAVVKTFIFLSVKILFDPPSNASLYGKYTETLEEYKSRILYDVDPRYE